MTRARSSAEKHLDSPDRNKAVNSPVSSPALNKARIRGSPAAAKLEAARWKRRKAVAMRMANVRVQAAASSLKEMKVKAPAPDNLKRSPNDRRALAGWSRNLRVNMGSVKQAAETTPLPGG